MLVSCEFSPLWLTKGLSGYRCIEGVKNGHGIHVDNCGGKTPHFIAKLIAKLVPGLVIRSNFFRICLSRLAPMPTQYIPKSSFLTFMHIAKHVMYTPQIMTIESFIVQSGLKKAAMLVNLCKVLRQCTHKTGGTNGQMKTV